MNSRMKMKEEAKKRKGMKFKPMMVGLSPRARLERKLLIARTPLERELLGNYKGALDSVLETHTDYYTKHPKDLKNIRAFLKDAIKVALADPNARKKVKLGKATPTYRRRVVELAKEIDKVATSVELRTPRRAKKETFEAYQRRIERFYNRPRVKKRRVYAAVRIMQRMAKAGKFGTAREMLAAREKTARKKIVPVPITVYTYHFYAAPADDTRKTPLERYRRAKKFEITSSKRLPAVWNVPLSFLKGTEFNKQLRAFGITSVVNLRNRKDKNPNASLAENLKAPLTTDMELIEVARKTIKRPRRKRV